MQVLQLISSLGFFGAENVVLELALGMERAGVGTAVVGVFRNEQAVHLELAEECERRDVETLILPCRGRIDGRTVALLRRFVQQRGIRCLHSHGYKSNLYGLLATAGLGAFRVSTCHNWLGDDWKMRLYASLDRFALRRFDVVVAVSGEVREKILAGGVRPERVRLIPNGIPLERFGRADEKRAREELGIDSGAVVVGTVGRLSEEKGHRTLLRAVRQIQASRPEVLLLLVGDGPLRSRLEREFASPGIRFLGIRRDVAVLYGCMDIFALPSLTEGLPVALLEAMASGLPVVATAVGDVPRVLAGGCGVLVEPGREDALQRALVALLDRPEERRALGEAGRRRVEAAYGADRMMERYREIYQEAGGRKPRAGSTEA